MSKSRQHSGLQIFINLLLTFCILFLDLIIVTQIFILFYFQKSHWSWRSMIKHFVPTGPPTLLVIGRGGFTRGVRSTKLFRSDGAYSRGTCSSTVTSPQTSMDRVSFFFSHILCFKENQLEWSYLRDVEWNWRKMRQNFMHLRFDKYLPS